MSVGVHCDVLGCVSRVCGDSSCGCYNSLCGFYKFKEFKNNSCSMIPSNPLKLSWLPQKFQKKPLVIEAMEITSATVDAVRNWAGQNVVVPSPVLESTEDNLGGVYYQVHTLEGTITCVSGDFIIKGIKGEVYPCRRDIFLETYEIVKE